MRRFRAINALLALLLFLGSGIRAQNLDFLNHNQPVVDAHNCYPEDGRWRDRIDRALSTGYPVAIEQDLAWYNGQVVVSHEAKAKGGEPTLRQYFFNRVRPLVEQALKQNDRSRWPILVLHFDFKSNEEPLLRAVWKLLGEYPAWLTTARKTTDPQQLAPFEPGPVLVITEDSDAQQKVFFDELAPGDKLRLFGSAHSLEIPARSDSERQHLEATIPPQELLSERPTNYRRWWNSSWFKVEEGGQHHAGAWTDADDRRLRALVDHAHRLGYWIRFYTIDGFTAATSQGWNDSYNFGSRESAAERWRAAVRAGVNLIATDQYEDLAKAMRELR
jgi:hypothetical protein